MNLIIADTNIRQDAEGRYCLNDLHRAAGGEKRHQPSDWLRMGQTQELIAEMEIPGIPGIESKQGVGTFVAKELVYAYAMWISAAFHLKVIRAYDAMVAQPMDPMKALNDPAAMRGLLLTYTERVIDLEATVAEQAPKVAALDRIETRSKGSLCIRDAAKTLQIQEGELKQLLIARKWVYRRPMGAGLLAYSQRLQQGYMEHKYWSGTKPDGTEWSTTQANITAKGLVQLAQILTKGVSV